MHKKLTVLAVAAGLAAAPMAASAAPTVYSHLQVELANVTNDGYGENYTGGAREGVAPGESALKLADNKRGRIGVKGKEDLGGDLMAIYKFEWQVDTANGTLDDGARDTLVGLRGGFGEIQLGRLRTPYKYIGGVTYDPFVTTYLEARLSGGMLGGTFGQNAFWDTSVAYKNRWGDVSLWAVYGVDAGDGTDNWMKDPTKTATADQGGANGDYTLGLKYQQSGWEAFLVTIKNNVADPSQNSWSANKLGGQLKSGPHTLSAQYEWLKDETVAVDQDTNILFLGYQFRMGRNSLVVQYGRTDAENDANDVDYSAIGLIHRLSKKTRLFIGYRNSDKTDSGAIANDLSVISSGLRIDF